MSSDNRALLLQCLMILNILNAEKVHLVLFCSLNILFFLTQVADEVGVHPTSLPARTRPTRLMLAWLLGFLL